MSTTNPQDAKRSGPLSVKEAAGVGAMVGFVLALFTTFFGGLIAGEVLSFRSGRAFAEWQITNEVRDAASKCFLAYHYGALNEVDEGTKIGYVGGKEHWDHCQEMISEHAGSRNDEDQHGG